MENYCKVLIIDDEFIMRQGMKYMMDWEKEGFQIVGEATNGQEGLDLIEQVKPDIVLADIVMPVLDGIEFSKILGQRHPEIQLVILSSYDKFEYVKSTLLNGAVDYILKPTLNPEILLKTLNKAARNIPGLVLRKDKEMSPEIQIERYLMGYQERLDEAFFVEVFPHTLYRMAGMNLKALCGSHKLTMDRIFDMVLEYFEEKKEYVSVSVMVEAEILCLILNYRVKDEKTVLADLKTCAERVRGMKREAFLVAGQSFTSLKAIKDCYQRQIQPYVDQKFYYPNRCFMVTGDTQEEKKENRFAFEEYSNELLRRQYQKAAGRFEAYVEEMLDVRVEEYRLKNTTRNLLYSYLIELERYHVPSEELKKRYFGLIEKSMDVEGFREVVRLIFAELAKIREEKIEVEDERILRMKEYISRHYAESMEMSDLADAFGFSYNYLSSYFNRQTREGFSEYLNKIRLDNAKDLLKDTDLTIAEISSAVGYGDQSYFCRVFKKQTGVTPSAYRRKC